MILKYCPLLRSAYSIRQLGELLLTQAEASVVTFISKPCIASTCHAGSSPSRHSIGTSDLRVEGTLKHVLQSDFQ
jgi:hypothetical protein